MRNLTDPNDPLYPKVRKLHLKIWAKGTLESRNIGIVGFCFMWLLMNIATFAFFLGWRIFAIIASLYVIDLIYPEHVSCLLQDFVGAVWFIEILSPCAFYDYNALYLPKLLMLILVIFLVTFPQKKFAQKVGEILFMFLNIILIGLPLKLIAFLMDKDTSIFESWIDRSYTFGPVSTAMAGIFPPPYQYHSDYLWNTYFASNKEDGPEELANVIAEFEKLYLE